MKLDKNYWSDRYKNKLTQWDAGAVTEPLRQYFDQLNDKKLKILIPGCGNAHEAVYLHNTGFKRVYIVDISPLPLNKFKQENTDFPVDHILNKDFFELKDSFDLIIEQTFFCALEPTQRKDYAKKVYELLKPGGRLVGVLFNDELNKDHPPFGGEPEEYEQYFRPFFKFHTYDSCYNSINPRKGREWFINLLKI